MSGDNAKMSESVRAARLEWQSELDATMADIDSRLIHPRRRGDRYRPAAQLPGTRLRSNLTTEVLDEIAWRVAEQMRRQRAWRVAVAAPPDARRQTGAAAASRSRPAARQRC